MKTSRAVARQAKAIEAVVADLPAMKAQLDRIEKMLARVLKLVDAPTEKHPPAQRPRARKPKR